MKTEDIDKRIGMPDVDAEWARFEQEVIGKETKASKRSLYSWIGSFAIAASVVIVAGLFFLNHDSKETIFDATKAEQQKFLAKNQNIKPDSFKDLEKSLQHQPHKDTNPKGSIAGMAPRKELALANADAPATTGLDISHREYTGEVQKFNMDDVKDLAFESVDQALQNIASADLSSGTTMRLRGIGDSKPDSFLVVVNGKTLFDSRGMASEEIDRRIEEYLNEKGLLQNIKIPWDNGSIAIWASTPEEREELQRIIATATIVPTSADLGNPNTLRLRGSGDNRPSDKDRIDSTLILVNGEPLPNSLKWQVLGESIDDVDTYMPRYFSQQGLLIDSVYVHKDSKFTEKYGGLAKYGVIEIKTVPDTYCDAYVRKHPKLMKKYHRIEGYVMNDKGKPLTEAWVHLKKEFMIGAATDSTGHFVFWVPKKDVMLCAEQAGYRTVEFSPSDKTLVMHLEPGASMRLRGNPEPTSELQGVIAGLPDAPPNDSILYIVNGVPQPKENNKWLGKMSYLDYFKRQHLLVDSIKRNMNEEAKRRYLERFGLAAKHGVVEYFCVEDTLCDYYMNQHEELKASRRRVSGVVLDENDEPLDHTLIHILQFQPEKKIWGVETTDSLGNFAFWVPRTDIELHFKYIGYKAVVVEPTDTFLTVRLVPNSNVNDQNLRLRGNPKPTSESQGQIAGLPDTPPNDSILYLINGKPQPKENNKWLSKDTYLDYFKKQHLHVERVMDYTNVKQRYIEKFGEAAKYGVVEYICVEDTRGDYYIEQHEELKANRRRVSGVVLDENDKPLGNTKIFILHDKKIWGTETTDSSGNYAFWVPRTDVKLDLTHYGYKPVVVEPTDTFQTIHLLPTATMQSTK